LSGPFIKRQRQLFVARLKKGPVEKSSISHL
jgi:hypothetical protein